MLAVLALAGAQAGQIMVEEVTWREAARHAEAAVVLRLDTPAERPVQLPVEGAPGRPCAPYDFVAWRGTVEAIVAAPRAGLPVSLGAPLNVQHGSAAELVALSEAWCREGMSRSPVRLRMAGGVTPRAGEAALVLLRWEARIGWLEAIDGAWLPARRREAVRRAVGVRTFSSVDEAPGAPWCVVDGDCGDGRRCVVSACVP